MEMTIFGGTAQESVWDLLRLGDLALSENKLEEAVSYFEDALKADPFSVKAYRRVCEAYWLQGRTEDALNSLSRALELEPNDRETVLQCCRGFRECGKEDFAAEVLQSFLNRNPEDELVRAELESLDSPTKSEKIEDIAEFFNQQGKMQFQNGNLEHAVACFEMAIENDPERAEPHNNLGVIEWKNGELTKALEHFYKALELKPGDTEILGNSARVLFEAGQLDAALGVMREYLQRCPGDLKGWDEYDCLLRQNESSTWKPNGLPTEVAEIYASMAKSLAEAGDLTGAAEAVERALQIKPADPEALFVLASLHESIGQVPEAEKLLGEVLLIDPGHAQSADLLRSIRGNGTCT